MTRGYSSYRKREQRTTEQAADNQVKKHQSVSGRAKNTKAAETDHIVPIQNAHMDYTIFLVVIVLLMFGIVMIFSSSYYHVLTTKEDMYFLLRKQLMFSAIGLTALFVLYRIPYHIYRRLAFLGYVFSNVLLVLVLFFGVELNGSKRWFEIFGIQFQPSEIAKVAVILYLATILAYTPQILKTVTGFLKCCVILFIPVALIAVENLSTAIVVAFIGMAVMFIASPKIWYFIAISVPVFVGGAIMIMLPEYAYRFDRIKAWRDPFSDPTGIGFQVVQSLYAIASGGLFGVGLGQSRQKLGYIPEAYNDIIFSIICEELGLVGAITLLILFAALIYRGIKVALNAQDMFGCLIAFGIVSMIAIQVLINIAVVTNTIPVTGMALPFISYGGTSLVVLMGSIGILLNISTYQR